MNLSKLLILGLLVQVTTSFCNVDDDIRHINEVLEAKSKKIDEAEEIIDVLKAIGEYNKSITRIKKVYLDLP